MKRYLALILLIAMLFSGCREGGYDNTSGIYTSQSFEEFSVGERSRYSSVSSTEKSSYSSSTVSSSSSESTSSSTVSSSSSGTSVSSQSSVSSKTSSGAEPPIAESTPSQISSSERSSRFTPTVIPGGPISDLPMFGDILNDDMPNGNTVHVVGVAGSESSGSGTGSSSVSASSSAASSSSSDPISSSFASVSSDFSEPEPKMSPYDYDGPVYVAASGNGIRFHLYPSCSNMKGTIEMYVPEAVAKGFTPCMKCWEL